MGALRAGLDSLIVRLVYTVPVGKLNDIRIFHMAQDFGYSWAMVKSIADVEGQGYGFDPATGKILIQFEPGWFKRQCHEWREHAQGHTWINNKVENQREEWKAFNDAFYIDADAAMESTSIGMMQVMGFHWKELGFDSVGAMWDYAKESEENQLHLALKFCKSVPPLDRAIKAKDCIKTAYYYNGEQYKKYNYDTRLLRRLRIYQKQNFTV